MKLSDVAHLVKLLDKSSLTELSFSDENTRVVLKKGTGGVVTAIPMQQVPPPQYIQSAPTSLPSSQAAAPDAASVSEKSAPKGKEISSPMVGTFYAASSPGAPALVEVGATVKPGQVVCIIEAMKIMNEIESDVAGVVEEICVQNETPVEYGTVLFRVRPS